MRSLIGLLVVTSVGCEGAELAGEVEGAAESRCPIYRPHAGAGLVSFLDRPLPPIVPERSLVITRRDGYAAVAPIFTVGRVLTDEAAYLNEKICSDRPDLTPKDPFDFAIGPFKGGARDVEHHNEWPRVKVGEVTVARNAFEQRIVDRWVLGDPDGPFRLLAVVNRLDLAGDEDTRGGGQLAGGERRWFGEGRLVYGVTSDLSPSQPYPMTVIIEFRLPALVENTVNGKVSYRVDPDFDYLAGPSNDRAWREGRARWARIFGELSRWDAADPKFQALLLEVVKLFATADNHLAVRTGERLFDETLGTLSDEFEYREFYLNGEWNLSTRKIRREPVSCAQGSETLKARIDEEWNPLTGAFRFNYMLGERRLDDELEVPELSDRCGEHQYPSPDGMPYGQELGSGGYGLRAKFVRFRKDGAWSIPNVPEEKRRALALGSCSGCHGAETGNRGGFHVRPRLADQDAGLSDLLRGPIEVRPAGTIYSMDEPRFRSERLRRFAERYNFSEEYRAPKYKYEQLYCNASPCSATVYP